MGQSCGCMRRPKIGDSQRKPSASVQPANNDFEFVKGDNDSAKAKVNTREKRKELAKPTENGSENLSQKPTATEDVASTSEIKKKKSHHHREDKGDKSDKGDRKKKRKTTKSTKSREQLPLLTLQLDGLLPDPPQLPMEIPPSPEPIPTVRSRRICIRAHNQPWKDESADDLMTVISVQSASSKTTSTFTEVTLFTDIPHQPGDYLFVRPKNHPNDVKLLAELLQLDEFDLRRPFAVKLVDNDYNEVDIGRFRFDLPNTLGKIFSEEVDLSGPPTQNFLKVLSLETKLPATLQNCLADRHECERWIANTKPTVIDVIRQLGDQHTPVEAVVLGAPLIQPRCYLVASSTPGQISVCSQDVKITASRMGLCSRYLKNLKPNDQIFGTVTPAQGVLMPSSITFPMVMICGGIGAAPFKGFLDAAKQQKIRDVPLYLLYEFSDKSEAPYYHVFNSYEEYGFIEDMIMTQSNPDGLEGAALTDKLNKNPKWQAILMGVVTNKSGQIFLCGSDAFCDTLRLALTTLLKKDLNSVVWFHEERINVLITHALMGNDSAVDSILNSGDCGCGDDKTFGAAWEQLPEPIYETTKDVVTPETELPQQLQIVEESPSIESPPVVPLRRKRSSASMQSGKSLKTVEISDEQLLQQPTVEQISADKTIVVEDEITIEQTAAADSVEISNLNHNSKEIEFDSAPPMMDDILIEEESHQQEMLGATEIFADGMAKSCVQLTAEDIESARFTIISEEMAAVKDTIANETLTDDTDFHANHTSNQDLSATSDNVDTLAVRQSEEILEGATNECGNTWVRGSWSEADQNSVETTKQQEKIVTAEERKLKTDVNNLNDGRHVVDFYEVTTKQPDQTISEDEIVSIQKVAETEGTAERATVQTNNISHEGTIDQLDAEKVVQSDSRKTSTPISGKKSRGFNLTDFFSISRNHKKISAEEVRETVEPKPTVALAVDNLQYEPPEGLFEYPKDSETVKAVPIRVLDVENGNLRFSYNPVTDSPGALLPIVADKKTKGNPEDFDVSFNVTLSPAGHKRLLKQEDSPHVAYIKL